LPAAPNRLFLGMERTLLVFIPQHHSLHHANAFCRKIDRSIPLPRAAQMPRRN
jgi:hypothetical protein